MGPQWPTFPPRVSLPLHCCLGSLNIDLLKGIRGPAADGYFVQHTVAAIARCIDYLHQLLCVPASLAVGADILTCSAPSVMAMTGTDPVARWTWTTSATVQRVAH